MSDKLSVVADGLVVSFHYKLTDGEGEVIDTSAGREPLMILQGAENIVSGLEKALLGRSVGDSFEVSVPPEEGYGVPLGDGPQAIPRNAFPPDAELHPGMQFMVGDDDGGSFALFVVAAEEERVIVDRNHPLAGVTLNFAVTLTALREATDEERTHGHPHGPGGHGH